MYNIYKFLNFLPHLYSVRLLNKVQRDSFKSSKLFQFCVLNLRYSLLDVGNSFKFQMLKKFNILLIEFWKDTIII